MAIRTVNLYCGNDGALVEHFIGTAYDVVKTVYENLGILQYIYDFLNQHGVLVTVDSVDELKALNTDMKYARVYTYSNTAGYGYTDYLYVEGNDTGVSPNATDATGTWVVVASSSTGGGESGSGNAYIPYVYAQGSALGGETTIAVPNGTVGVPFIIVEGYMNTVGYGFTFDATTLTVTLTQPLEVGDEVVLLLTGTPAVPDNPNISNWVTINWLYNGGYAVGDEQVIAIPYTFEAIPAIYKNGDRYYAGLADKSYTVDAANRRILLTEPLATNDRLIVQIGGESTTFIMSDRTVQEVARSANVHENEVILSTNTTQYLNGMKVIYDVVAQKIYGLPALPINVYINSVSNGQLTYSPNNITVNLLPVPDTGSILREDLSDISVDDGDALVATKQPIEGAKDKTVHDWLAEHISIKDMAGVIGDGVNDDAPGINAALTNLASSNKPVVFVPGVYLVNSNITFNVPVVFSYGAILKPRNGAVIRFNQQIEAGEYTIFDTTDDFVSNYLAVPSIKIPFGPVRIEWFGAKKVNTWDDIASASDCSDAFLKAWHATCGEFKPISVVNQSYLQSEFFHSYIKLGCGKYRMDKNLKCWYRVTSPSVIRYNKNGGGVIGEGQGLSLIVFTNSTYEGNAFMEFSDMSGQLHEFRDFEVTFYNPNKTDDDRWIGRAGAMILFSSADSILTKSIWISGARYIRLDSNGVRRGGVGIQFESLVGHTFDDLRAEHCIHGVAFSSCISTGTNIKGFANTVSDLAFGNYIPAWPDLIAQTQINLVTLSGLESEACPATPIYFGTVDNRVTLTGVNIKGTGESSSAIVTYKAIDFNPASPGAGATGLIQGNVMNVNYGLITDRTTAFAGRPGFPLHLHFNVYDVAGSAGTEMAVAELRNPSSNVRLRLGLGNSKLPALISSCNYTVADLDLLNVTGYAQAPYSAFICSAGNLLIEGLRASGTLAANLGYAGGSSKVTLPALMASSVTSIRKGTGSTADIRQVSSTLYTDIV